MLLRSLFTLFLWSLAPPFAHISDRGAAISLHSLAELTAKQLGKKLQTKTSKGGAYTRAKNDFH